MTYPPLSQPRRARLLACGEQCISCGALEATFAQVLPRPPAYGFVDMSLGLNSLMALSLCVCVSVLYAILCYAVRVLSVGKKETRGVLSPVPTTHPPPPQRKE